MQRVHTINGIKKLGTILSVWAHPDDESYACAGIMSVAVGNGQKVICVTATKGEAGIQDENRWPAQNLGVIRAKELEQALGIMGVSNHHWLGYKDGHCDDVVKTEATQRIIKLIDRYHPNTILTFGPEGLTGHTDHTVVSLWVDIATKGRNIAVYHAVQETKMYEKHSLHVNKEINIYFNIDKPPTHDIDKCDIGFSLTPELKAKKLECLQAMPSQTENMFRLFPAETISAMLNHECFMLAK